MTAPTAAMIFAAGFGTRMGDLTKNRPKPMIPVAGKPLIDHTLELASGLDPIVVNTHYLGDQIAHHLAGTNVQISHETDILETGGGLKNAAHLLTQPSCFTMNSDAIWVGPNPFDILKDGWRDDMAALLLLKHVDQTEGRDPPGDFSMDSAGRIRRGGPFVYLGAQIIETPLINTHPDDVFSLNVIWDAMIKEGRVFGCLYDGEWCDVGRPENIDTAELMLRNANV